MIRFGLRLTLGGGREALARLIIISAAVALGVGMLLTTLAGINAVNAQNARYAWLETGAGAPSDTTRGGADPLWWLLSADEFHGKVIGRVDVAASGPHSPLPPGITRLPGAGQYFASPTLAAMLRSAPADQLGDRYPGRQIGTIGPAGLPAPNSLLIVVGRTAHDLARAPDATRVTSISTTAPNSCNGACFAVGIDAQGMDLILSVVAAALLFPVLIFIGVATRLSAARREQRFAAMRLVGATPNQIAIIAAVESCVAAVLGVAVGFGLFFALRPVLAPIPFTGAPFFVGDLSLNLVDTVCVALGVPLAAAVVARLALRRVNISPLGVSRRVTPRPPTAWRLAPLLAGLGELGYFAIAGRPATTGGQILAFMSGILVTMAGLVIAGPWFTMIGSRVLARRATRPATLIAARRLSDNPQAGFRAISGLVLALFVTSVAIGVITTIRADQGESAGTAADRATIIDDFTRFTRSGPTTPVRAVPHATVAALNSIPGINAITVISASPRPSNEFNGWPAVVSCADLAHTTALGRCPAGAQTAAIEPEIVGSKFAPRVWPDAHVRLAELPGLAVRTLVVGTDGDSAVIERVRTVLERTLPIGSSFATAPVTVRETQVQHSDAQRAAAYQRLADVVILTSLPIAGCTLAVSVVAGLNDRRRPFSLLRLAGAPLRTLRRVVALESSVPLLVGAVVAIGAGFVAAYLFLRSQLNETLLAPDAAYYGVVAAGLLASLAIIASTLPVLEQITGPESARSD